MNCPLILETHYLYCPSWIDFVFVLVAVVASGPLVLAVVFYESTVVYGIQLLELLLLEGLKLEHSCE